MFIFVKDQRQSNLKSEFLVDTKCLISDKVKWFVGHTFCGFYSNLDTFSHEVENAKIYLNNRS